MKKRKRKLEKPEFYFLYVFLLRTSHPRGCITCLCFIKFVPLSWKENLYNLITKKEGLYSLSLFQLFNIPSFSFLSHLLLLFINFLTHLTYGNKTRTRLLTSQVVVPVCWPATCWEQGQKTPAQPSKVVGNRTSIAVRGWSEAYPKQPPVSPKSAGGGGWGDTGCPPKR